MTPKEAGQAFLAEVLAQVPEDRRSAVQEALTASEQALATLGAGVLRQSDYSRRMDEATAAQRQADATRAQADAFRAELDQWYTTNKPKLDEYDRLRAGGGGNPTPPTDPTPPAGTYLTREQFEDDLRQREAAVAGAIVNVPVLALKHFQTFNEVLDVHGLMKDPDIRTVGLDGVYQKVYGPKLAEKAKAAEDARIEAEVQRRYQERLAANPRMPYPTTPREPSPLDRLEQVKPGEPPAPVGDVVDLAVQQYNEALAREYGTARA